ncbi:MAG: hypothetical protein ACI85I_002227 [Arenicella sp.]|jgi:hypothetical protein
MEIEKKGISEAIELCKKCISDLSGDEAKVKDKRLEIRKKLSNLPFLSRFKVFMRMKSYKVDCLEYSFYKKLDNSLKRQAKGINQQKKKFEDKVCQLKKMFRKKKELEERIHLLKKML